MKEIPLTQGKVAIVDDEDFEWLSEFKWHAHRKHRQLSGPQWYARRGRSGPQMHRMIMGVTDPKVPVDHRDGDGLNDQRSNLRLSTPGQNACNKKSRGGSSQYKGVYWHKRNNKWRSAVMIDRHEKHLGYFEDEIEAAKAYDRAARELHGEFARTNF